MEKKTKMVLILAIVMTVTVVILIMIVAGSGEFIYSIRKLATRRRQEKMSIFRKIS